MTSHGFRGIAPRSASALLAGRALPILAALTMGVLSSCATEDGPLVDAKAVAIDGRLPVWQCSYSVMGHPYVVLETADHCAPYVVPQTPPLPKSMSWDQENLKTRDSEAGCKATHGIPIYVDDLFLECQ